jgi:anthranilate synthase component 2
MILILDNYDSFTYNLYQALAKMGEEVKVVRSDQITLEEIEAMNPSGIVLSPGPGRPEDAGVCIEAIRRFGSKLPILGVCLGHQAIGIAYGGQVHRSAEIFHGKESLVFHNRKGLFEKMPLPFRAGRYHSLLIDRASLPRELEVIAETPEGLIMAVAHRTDPVFGVQFHPESILTPEGETLLSNFLKVCRCISNVA